MPDDRHAEKEPDEPRIERDGAPAESAEGPEAALPKGADETKNEPAAALADGGTETGDMGPETTEDCANDR